MEPMVNERVAHPGEAPRESTLLVVDDDEDVRHALRRVFRRARWRVLDAPDADVALAILATHPVQVVVSDHRMPGRSGVELLREMKERWPRVQRVLLAGQADSIAIEEAVNHSEIFRLIWKPWDDGHLLLTIQSAIDQYWVADENARLQSIVAERNEQLERLNRDLDGKLAARSAALVRAAQEWRGCFDAIGDPLAIATEGGCAIVRANTAFAGAAGVPASALAGLRCVEHAYGKLPCPSRWVLPHAATEREATFGGRTWVVRSFPFADREDTLIVVFEDVTEKREVARRLSQAEKMAAVGQLAGGVAHEINNPLGGILAFAQMMSREERSEDDAEKLRLIQDAAMRAKGIVDSLLRFSRRPQPQEKRAVDLAQVAEDALFLVRPQLNRGRIEVVRAFGAAIALGNANQLQQVALNLIVNAVQAMPDGGRLTVSVGPAAPGHVKLAIADTGPGVEPELAKRIFEPFFTTKPEGQGTGLGLSICYQIAEEHGGSIKLEPGDAGGSFVLEIPAASD
jgi:two-component system, NtrC family, sensor kinase